MNQEKFNQVFEDLSAQRRKVLLRFLAGEKDLAIAASLVINESTVRKHIQEICDAFKCEPDESRSKRPDLIALFRKYKPELVKERASTITSEVEAQETAEVAHAEGNDEEAVELASEAERVAGTEITSLREEAARFREKVLAKK